jgi:hypothetical protein
MHPFCAMSTHAQDFRSEQLKLHSGAKARKARARATTRVAHQLKARQDHATHATHNEAPRAQSRSSYELEPGTRKSTRLGKNRSKTDSALKKTVTARSTSPKQRAARQKEGGR